MAISDRRSLPCFSPARGVAGHNGVTRDAPIDKAFKRAEAIFAKYPIIQA